VTPRDVVTDGGYASLKNQEIAKGKGVVNIVFNKIVGSLKNITTSLNMETRLKKWRSGIEAVISNVKRGSNCFRCDWKGKGHFDAKVLWSVNRLQHTLTSCPAAFIEAQVSSVSIKLVITVCCKRLHSITPLQSKCPLPSNHIEQFESSLDVGYQQPRSRSSISLTSSPCSNSSLCFFNEPTILLNTILTTPFPFAISWFFNDAYPPSVYDIPRRPLRSPFVSDPTTPSYSCESFGLPSTISTSSMILLLPAVRLTFMPEFRFPPALHDYVSMRLIN